MMRLATVTLVADVQVVLCCWSAVYAQDDEYAAAGATIVDHAASFKSDIVLKIRPPTIEEADMLKERAK
jgi:alanine dehydrogenase